MVTMRGGSCTRKFCDLWNWLDIAGLTKGRRSSFLPAFQAQFPATKTSNFTGRNITYRIAKSFKKGTLAAKDSSNDCWSHWSYLDNQGAFDCRACSSLYQHLRGRPPEKLWAENDAPSQAASERQTKRFGSCPILVIDELIRGKPFSQARYQAILIFAYPAYCRGYHQIWTWAQCCMVFIPSTGCSKTVRWKVMGRKKRI